MRLPASWHQFTRVAGVALAASVALLAAVAPLAAVAYGAGATASASSGPSFGAAARIAVGAAAESLISPPDRLVAWHGQVPRGSSDRRPGT